MLWWSAPASPASRSSWTAHFGGDDPCSIAFEVVVNAAGLRSLELAANTDIESPGLTSSLSTAEQVADAPDG